MNNKIVGWITGHKVAAACIAGGLAVVLAVGGGFAISALNSDTRSVAQEAETPQGKYAAASDGWDKAKENFDAAVAKRDATIEKTPEARATGVTNQAQAKTAFAAALAAKVEVKPLRNLVGNINDTLTEETFGVTEGDDVHAIKTPEVPDRKPELVKGDDADYELFTGRLEDDIRQFEEATTSVHHQTESAELFLRVLTGKSVAEAYLKSAPTVLSYVEGAGAADAATALKAAITKKDVSAQNLIDAFNAISALKGEAPIVAPETPGTNNNNPGNNTNPGGGANPPPPAPPVVEPPAPPVPTGPTGDAHGELAGRYGANNLNDDCYPANSGSSTSAASLPPFMGVGAKGWEVWADGDRWYVKYWSC